MGLTVLTKANKAFLGHAKKLGSDAMEYFISRVKKVKSVYQNMWIGEKKVGYVLRQGKMKKLSQEVQVFSFGCAKFGYLTFCLSSPGFCNKIIVYYF